MATRPSAAVEREAGFYVGDFQAALLIGIGHDGFDIVFKFVSGQQREQICRWSLLSKILFEKIGRAEWIYIAIFELHRHAVFFMHDCDMEERACGLKFKVFNQVWSGIDFTQILDA